MDGEVVERAGSASSRAPAAPMQCPMKLFVLLIQVSGHPSPKTALMASHSWMSPWSVAVAWVLTMWTPAGPVPALATAFRMHSA